MSLGAPRVHHRRTGSTNDEARALALAGAPHGALVTASEQLAGRGRGGRRWEAPPGSALLCSLVAARPAVRCCSLRAGVAVADALDARTQLKWPNDVLIDGRKVAGILVEARPRERWAVLGIGVNVAVELAQLPSELRETAGDARPRAVGDRAAARLAAERTRAPARRSRRARARRVALTRCAARS